MWDTAGAPWVSGNDASALKPCLNPGSSSDEDFTGSKTASLAAVFVYNFYVIWTFQPTVVLHTNLKKKKNGIKNKGELKSSYDIISAVDDLFDLWNASTATLMEEVFG